MNKNTCVKSFASKFDEFCKYLLKIVPNNPDVMAFNTGIMLIRRSNPLLLLQSWCANVFGKYADQISEGNLTYFLEKDYKDDLQEVQHTEQVLEGIDRIRKPIASLAGEELDEVVKFLQNLNTICFQYLSLK